MLIRRFLNCAQSVESSSVLFRLPVTVLTRRSSSMEVTCLTFLKQFADELFIVLHCIALYCVVLYCIVLYCIALWKYSWYACTIARETIQGISQTEDEWTKKKTKQKKTITCLCAYFTQTSRLFFSNLIHQTSVVYLERSAVSFLVPVHTFRY